MTVRWTVRAATDQDGVEPARSQSYSLRQVELHTNLRICVKFYFFKRK